MKPYRRWQALGLTLATLVSSTAFADGEQCYLHRDLSIERQLRRLSIDLTLLDLGFVQATDVVSVTGLLPLWLLAAAILWWWFTPDDAPDDVKDGIVYYGVYLDGDDWPAGLYQATLEGLVMFCVLVWYSRKPRPRYAVSGLFALLYGCFRFLVEFVREPDAQLGYLAFGWLTMGQVLSIPLILLGLFWCWKSHASPTLMPQPAAEAAK